MKLDTNELSNKILPILERLRRSTKLIFFLAVALVLGYIILRINTLAGSEPTPEEISIKLLEAKNPRVDEKTVNILKELEDSNTQVQSIFQQARENPFSE